jgi:HEAT repeat protein
MSISRSYRLVVLLLLIQFALCADASTPQQNRGFTARVVELTISDIAENGPSLDTARFGSRSMDLLWPKRRELLKVTSPYLNSPDSSKAAAATEILYRLRSYHPMAGFGFNEEAWQKENRDFLSEVDTVVYQDLEHLLTVRDNDLLRNLAEYLGSSVSSEVSKKALLELAKNPEVREQALICLTWHKDKRDMDDLLPFMLDGTTSLPYQFRNNYGTAALPYLLKALAQAPSPFVRLQSAEQLVFMNEKAGVKYLYEAVLHRNELPNGTAQAGEIMQFAVNHLGFQNQGLRMDELERFLKNKLHDPSYSGRFCRPSTLTSNTNQNVITPT